MDVFFSPLSLSVAISGLQVLLVEAQDRAMRLHSQSHLAQRHLWPARACCLPLERQVPTEGSVVICAAWGHALGFYMFMSWHVTTTSWNDCVIPLACWYFMDWFLKEHSLYMSARAGCGKLTWLLSMNWHGCFLQTTWHAKYLPLHAWPLTCDIRTCLAHKNNMVHACQCH